MNNKLFDPIYQNYSLPHKIQPEHDSYKIKELSKKQIIKFDVSNTNLKTHKLKKKSIKYFDCRYRSNNLLTWKNIDDWSFTEKGWTNGNIRIHENYLDNEKFEYDKCIFKSYDPQIF